MEGEFKLFVSNVPYNCTEEEFKTFMLTLEGVTSARLVQKPNTGINRGYGFVTVSTPEKQAFLLKNDNVIFNGRKLKMTEYVNQQKFYKLHVMNVPETVTDQTLYEMFSKFGTVDNVKRDFNVATRTFKGTALVVFTNYEDFNKVLTQKELEFSDGVKLTVTKRRLPFRKPQGRGTRPPNPRKTGEKLEIKRQ